MALTTTDLKAIQKIVVSTEKKLITRMDQRIGSTEKKLITRMDQTIGSTEKKLITRMDQTIGSTEKKLMTRMDSTQRDLAGRMLDAVQKMIDYAVNGLEDRLSKKISHLPTKEEFFSMEDKVVGELQKTRDEHIVIQGQVFRHTDEIMALQDIHLDNKHSFTHL